MHSMKNDGDKQNKTGKGINQIAFKNLKHEEYTDVLFNEKVVRYSMKTIQRMLRKIGSYDVCTISLSCFDDKGYVLDDGINTLAYFHKDTRSQ